MSSALASGAVAPEFQLNSTPDQKVKLSEFRGNPVILAFYPADWSPVCGDQMSLYNEGLGEFRKHGA
jgi:peroxiredoxin